MFHILFHCRKKMRLLDCWAKKAWRWVLLISIFQFMEPGQEFSLPTMDSGGVVRARWQIWHVMVGFVVKSGERFLSMLLGKKGLVFICAQPWNWLLPSLSRRTKGFGVWSNWWWESDCTIVSRGVGVCECLVCYHCWVLFENWMACCYLTPRGKYGD